MDTKTQTRWWEYHSNLVLLTAYLAEVGEDAAQLAYAVEKPWKFEEEFVAAGGLVGEA